MNAHAHSPGGEFMFVAGGRGRIWIEGIPLRLDPGCSSFIPAGLLHNAENTQARDLLIIGVTAPGVIPGSYAEVPPLFTPTGRISGVETFACASAHDSAPHGATAVQLVPSTDKGLSVAVRLVKVDPLATVTVGGSMDRAWVAVRGVGMVACRDIAGHRISRYAIYSAGAGTAMTVTAGPSGVALLEVRHAATPG